MGPIELELNSQYNAIIGGRGTGKSTILEYLRWGLCDQQQDIDMLDEISSRAARQQRLIDQTLKPFGSQVDVHLLVNGVSHVVRRNAGTGDVQLRISTGEFERISEADVRALVPIHAYSQKQLSSIAVKLEELTRFVTAPIQDALREIDAQIEALAGKIRQNHVSLRRHRLLASNIARDELTLASLSSQTTSLRASLEDVSDEDREILSQRPAYDAANDLMASWQRRLEEVAEVSGRFSGELDDLVLNLPGVLDDLPYSGGLRATATEVGVLIDAMRKSTSDAIIAFQSGRVPGSPFQVLVDAWDAEQQAYEARYAAVQAASSAHKTKIAQLRDLERRHAEVRGMITEQREELARLGDPLARHRQLREDWLALLRRRSEHLEARCHEITELSDGVIRAGVKQADGLSALRPRIRAAVAGSNLRTGKIDGLIETIGKTGNPLLVWETILGELESSMRLTPESDVTPTPGAIALLSAYGLTTADISKVLDRLTPDSWLDLALTPITDQAYFEFMAKKGEYIDFSAASPGQQATALLRILLNQEGQPLIIDQPEDDLDSPIIQEIVSKIWAAKGKRQLIFASHNANLVVNGDAELVICCDHRAMGDYSGGRVKLEGAIDMPPVRTEITQIMEGGERAFKLRKDKYGF